MDRCSPLVETKALAGSSKRMLTFGHEELGTEAQACRQVLAVYWR